MITLDQIYRYPVKGFSPDRLTSVDVVAGKRLPFDRRFALAPATTPITGATSAWQHKSKFIMLMKHEKVASLKMDFDEATETITLSRNGKQLATGKLTDRIGRSMLEDFFAAYLKDEARGRPTLAEAEAMDDGAPGGLTDNPDALISIIGLPSIADLGERVVKQTVHPLRFRANLYLAGTAPWDEFQWIGKRLQIGRVVLEVQERLDRCAAINVNPETAERDMNLVKDMSQGYGHYDMGVLAKIVEGGTLNENDPVTIL